MSITVWHALISQYFELYLEEKLDLLGASIVKIQETASTASSTSFQLEGPLRQLPSTFLDASHAFVERLYHTLPDGYAGRDDRATLGHTEGHNPFLYGEVASEGIRQVMAELTKDSSTLSSSDPILFVDLGSGTGKMVVEMAHLLLTTTNGSTSHCIGIELDTERASVAERAHTSIKERGDKISDVIRFVTGDFLAWLRSPLDATSFRGTINLNSVLFCCGVGFGESFVSEICDAMEVYRLANQSQHTAVAPLRIAILLFRHHPKDHSLYTSASSRSMVFLNTSWMDEAPAMILRW